LEDLAKRRCKPCEWTLDRDAECIDRFFEFPAFSRTIAFVNAVAWIATNEGHHPELTVNYGSCNVMYRTHAIDGLSDNDFICAAKIDRLAEEL
jgi:4a-hydroxytetrahydrobiopterin dehydratase